MTESQKKQLLQAYQEQTNTAEWGFNWNKRTAEYTAQIFYMHETNLSNGQ